MTRYTKCKYILFTVLTINILLVATHEGEFWPFSIFPMFSQAGNPWSRGLVQKLEGPINSESWQPKPLSAVKNSTLSLDSIGVDDIDYANFVSKTRDWNPKRVKALRNMLDVEAYPGSKWMITQVKGYLTEDDSVVVQAIPLFLFTVDTTLRSPHLSTNVRR